jgi:hypothetical protein
MLVAERGEVHGVELQVREIASYLSDLRQPERQHRGDVLTAAPAS